MVVVIFLGFSNGLYQTAVNDQKSCHCERSLCVLLKCRCYPKDRKSKRIRVISIVVSNNVVPYLLPVVVPSLDSVSNRYSSKTKLIKQRTLALQSKPSTFKLLTMAEAEASAVAAVDINKDDEGKIAESEEESDEEEDGPPPLVCRGHVALKSHEE